MIEKIQRLIEVSKEKQRAILDRDIFLMETLGQEEARLAKTVNGGIDSLDKDTLKEKSFSALYTELKNVHEQNSMLLTYYKEISDDYFSKLKGNGESTYDAEGKKPVSTSRFYSLHA